jgi:hypothetical protein
MSFKAHCEQLGIDLLKDDFVFIKSCLRNVPKNSHKTVLRRYCDVWVASMTACSNDALKQSMGRREANTFLRELVE